MTPAQIETVKATANEFIKRDDEIARLRAHLTAVLALIATDAKYDASETMMSARHAIGADQ